MARRLATAAGSPRPCALLPLLLAAGTAGEDAYPWPMRSHNTKRTGASPHVGPRDLAKGPAWTWPNEGDELMRHSPLIDDKRNIYLLTAQGWVRKFSPDGAVLWTWRTSPEEGKIVASGTLYNGSLYLSSTGPASAFLFALSLDTRKVLLRKQLPPAMGTISQDSHAVTVHEGVVYLPSRDARVEIPFQVGNNQLVALSAADGSLLWRRSLAGDSKQSLLWNLSPSFPGDGTLLFSTPTARAYRLNASNGEIIWKASFPEPGGWMGCGGGALSPDGRRFFALGAYHQGEAGGTRWQAPLRTLPPCGVAGCHFGDGVVLAYDVADGAILWSRRFTQGTSGQQYPAVGGIDGPGSRTAVFLAVGINAPGPRNELGPPWMPQVAKRLAWLASWRSSWLRSNFGVPTLENHVYALDAETGHEIWRWEEEPWVRWGCKGDEEGLLARRKRFGDDPSREETACMPDSWAVPTLGADGTVYAASGHTGGLYAIRDADGDGRIGAGEVSAFEAQSGFLNAPSLAPGLLAASPCWGPMYVFKS